MFRRLLVWISHLWDLLFEFIVPSSSTPISHTQSTCASNATFVSTSSPTCWDVFLSFRGIDTRLNFTGHLYDKLDSNGIPTFMDDPELRSGQVISDALLDAIKKSKTYIVVLSENYAFSRWCLDELVEIFNCHKTAERLVIPVFYKIDPFVVRHQIGKFNQAFKKHRGRVKMEKVNKWRLALTRVAGLSGFHISQNTSEADINNQILEEILPKINSKVLNVAKYPVGLDSRVKALTTLLNSGTEEGFAKIGLYGMGGVGKTTLAKALFNQLLRRGSFKGSCFLANVRETSGTFKGIESLQKTFINDVLKCKIKIEVKNVEEGIMLIKERLCSAKVLVLIDDIDDPRQYESLVGSFSFGSIVIITTRDQEILEKIEVEPNFQYKVNELDDAQSLALFTRHAFRNAEQKNTLMALSADILRLADGLPLALEVFGSYLYNQSDVGWKSYIEKLQRVPNNDIQQKLLISLDAVELDDPMLKKMFLDIACFFIGWGKEEVVKILKTYYRFADHKIDILQKKCLVKINYNVYWKKPILDMHDLLRDMGREVVHNISPDEPGRQSRLWVSEDVDDVLKKHKGTEAIECIIPDNLDYKYHYLYLLKTFRTETIETKTFRTETFKRMSKLRFLYLRHVNLTGSLEQTFEDLRWFCWDGCPLKCFPSEFNPQKLVILELLGSKMRTMWELNVVPHVFGKLKTLDMSYSEDLTTSPDFTKLPCLETLDLEGCVSMKEVGISIGSLEKLVSLNLKGCEKLRSLPNTICNLTALELLDISRCTSLESLPIQLGNITSLTELNAEELTVSKLPDSIGRLTKLVKLRLRNNKKLETLPDTICNLRSLEILDIGYCSRLKALPTAIGNMESLKKIMASEVNVSKLPDSIGSLTKLFDLDLSENKKLETLPDTICNLRSLENLDIHRCEKLEMLPDELWKITRLRNLFASHTKLLKKLPDIGSSQIALSLQKIYLIWSGITALPSGFSQLSNLQSLQISWCVNLLSIPELPPNLKWIDASVCESLERLPNLSNLKHLEILELSECRGLTEIQGLEELNALKELDLRDCSGLKYIQGLDKLISIQKLLLDLGSQAYNLILTRHLFQIYSEFDHQISFLIENWESDSRWPNWLVESPYWTSESSESSGSTTVYAHLLPNESHNFMGIILCFEKSVVYGLDYGLRVNCSIKNTASGFIWRSHNLYLLSKDKSLIVLVPNSIFSITDDDLRIEFTASNNVKIVGIHLLYKKRDQND